MDLFDIVVAKKMAGGSGGGLGGADWNAAEGEAGYVLNRTHWVEGGGAVLLPESVGVYDASMRAFGLLGTMPELVEGQTYEVSYNGAKYISTAKYIEYQGLTGVTVGNVELAEGKDNGLPFSLMSLSEAYQSALGVCALAIPFDGATSVTFSVKEPDVVHKIDEKFLPVPQMVINLVLGGSGSGIDKSYHEIRSHIYSGGLACLRFVNENNITLYQFAETTNKELKFRNYSIDFPTLHINTFTIDRNNALSLVAHHVNIDSVD